MDFIYSILKRSLLFFFISVIAISLVSCTKPSLITSTPVANTFTIKNQDNFHTNYWVPSTTDKFQIQLSDYPPDLSIDADIFVLDLFETPHNVIDTLHKKGKKVICYINVGAWEEYRPDAGNFPAAVIGREYVGWEGESWLNISQYEYFSHIIRARFDLAKDKDCDGIDPDNINGFQQETGFAISYEDQLTYNIWLSKEAHMRNLSIGLKNNGLQINDLVDHYDFAIIENCLVYSECERYNLFIELEKAVFQIEYTDYFNSLDDYCSNPNNLGFVGVLKNRELDSWVQRCGSPNE